MTLESKVLERLAEQAGSSRRHDFQVNHSESGWNVSLIAERRDDLGCLVWELALRRQPGAGDLEVWAKGVVERTLALVERFSVYEIDPTRNQGLLRTIPTQRHGHKLYFEVHLHGLGSMTLRRFQTPEQTGQRREQVAFALTSETLARLVGELTGA
jgi:hypothetical protein